uniref:C2H2-type domain-containing protein n=1 Tax=Panagrellus redivivus TaxID=6233 RepID=A0A7E4VPM9_PANRE
MTRKHKAKTPENAILPSIAELQELLTTVKLPTLHPDANFPKKSPPNRKPTYGKRKFVKPVVEFDYKSLNPPSPRVLLKKIDAYVCYRCDACDLYFKTASQHEAHVLEKINAHETGDGLIDAPTFVFGNNAPIGMEFIEKNEEGYYYCTLCGVDAMKLEALIYHVIGQRHWKSCKKLGNYGKIPVKFIYPSLYINEIAGYLDSFPFVDSVKALALSKPPVPTFDEICLASVEVSHIAHISNLAAKKALFDFLDEGLQTVGTECVKKCSIKKCKKFQWYCRICNCQLVKDATKRDRNAHYTSRQHHNAWAKEKEETKKIKQSWYALKNPVFQKFELSGKENYDEKAADANQVQATQNAFSSLCEQFRPMSLIVDSHLWINAIVDFFDKIKANPMLLFTDSSPLNKFEGAKSKKLASIAHRAMMEGLSPPAGYQLSDTFRKSGAKLQGVPLTNVPCESVFSTIDWTYRRAPNMNTCKRYVQSKTEEEQDALFEKVLSHRPVVEKLEKHKKAKLTAELIKLMEEEELKKARNRKKNEDKKQKLLEDLETVGIWTNVLQLQNAISKLKPTKALEAVKNNIRYRKLVNKGKVCEEKLFRFQVSGYKLSIDDLISNLSQLITMDTPDGDSDNTDDTDVDSSSDMEDEDE